MALFSRGYFNIQVTSLSTKDLRRLYHHQSSETLSQCSNMSTTDADPLQYEQQVYASGLHSSRPPFTFQTSEWENLAKPVLSGSAWGYIHGNAGAGSTYTKNLESFSKYSIVPRRLVPSLKDSQGNELFSNASTTVLGEKLNFPIACAPVGVQKIFNAAGENAASRAAASIGVPYILSTASSTSIEDVAKASGEGGRDGSSFTGLHVSTTTSQSPCSIVRRRQAIPRCSSRWIPLSLAGDRRIWSKFYCRLLSTSSTQITGFNSNGYNPFLHADRIGVEIGFTDPVFRAKFKEEHGYDIEEDAKTHPTDIEGGSLSKAAQEWTKVVFPGHSKSWDDIKFLQEHWDGTIVLKGIQSVADAKKAVEVGVQGIVVSNHGGRQHDGGVPSLAMLPRIVDAVGEKIDVLFDSGVRCGADVLKAVALGAKCVLVGRPYIYGLALGGEEGVRHVLRALCGEIVMGMHLAGLRTLGDVDRDILVRDVDLF
ncbi:putative lactate 2-monooxygenase [Lachnellula occidentalis]|uniref:Putative lactate 2-monooxygenase n=1 Tax=Lachnellula occidentalis TaxID=215460 RepID=A0A8H8UIP5_9HELO|nr:putative lactate 2-monooxygenase [Lachnellula occidentalis]